MGRLIPGRRAFGIDLLEAGGGLLQIPEAPFHVGVLAHGFKKIIDGLDAFPGGRIGERIDALLEVLRRNKLCVYGATLILGEGLLVDIAVAESFQPEIIIAPSVVSLGILDFAERRPDDVEPEALAFEFPHHSVNDARGRIEMLIEAIFCRPRGMEKDIEGLARDLFEEEVSHPARVELDKLLFLEIHDRLMITREGMVGAGVDQGLFPFGDKLLEDDVGEAGVGVALPPDFFPEVVRHLLRRQLPIGPIIEVNHPEFRRARRERPVELPGFPVDVHIFLVPPDTEPAEHEPPRRILRICFAGDEGVNLVLVLIAAEFDPEVVYARFVQAREEAVDELDVVLDAVVFAEKDIVIGLEFLDDIILWRHLMSLEVGDELCLLLGRNLGQRLHGLRPQTKS